MNVTVFATIGQVAAVSVKQFSLLLFLVLLFSCREKKWLESDVVSPSIRTDYFRACGFHLYMEKLFVFVAQIADIGSWLQQKKKKKKM